jgi:ketosteroid isomerase-like protein
MDDIDQQTIRDVIDRYLAAYNAFDIDGMVALLSPDVRFENYAEGQLTVATAGLDDFRQLAEQSKALFSEREQRMTQLTMTPTAAIASIAYRGCLAVDIPDGPAAGTWIELQGQSEFSFRQGQICHIIDRS